MPEEVHTRRTCAHARTRTRTHSVEPGTGPCLSTSSSNAPSSSDTRAHTRTRTHTHAHIPPHTATATPRHSAPPPAPPRPSPSFCRDRSSPPGLRCSVRADPCRSGPIRSGPADRRRLGRGLHIRRPSSSASRGPHLRTGPPKPGAGPPWDSDRPCASDSVS